MATSGGTARSGAFGQARLGTYYVPRLKQWSVTCSASESAWGDSDSLGFTNRKKARKDCTGSLTGVQSNDATLDIQRIVGGTAAQTDLGGKIITIVLWELDRNNACWYFPCSIIQNFNITYDMDTKEVVEWSLDFAADGLFYRPQEAKPAGFNQGTYADISAIPCT